MDNIYANGCTSQPLGVIENQLFAIDSNLFELETYLSSIGIIIEQPKQTVAKTCGVEESPNIVNTLDEHLYYINTRIIKCSEQLHNINDTLSTQLGSLKLI